MRQLRYLMLCLIIPNVINAKSWQPLLDNSVVIHMDGESQGHKYTGTCTGTYIDKNSVLTAAHCVVEALPGKIWVKGPVGNSHPADISQYSISEDLALLYIHGPEHSFLKLGKFPRIGDKVKCVGCPLNINFLVSEGIVAGLNRHISPFMALYMLHTAMINPGSSGGGVFNDKNELIGVNTMITNIFGWEGISIAVDLKTINQFLS